MTMDCHNCNTTNPDLARFCLQCGAALHVSRDEEITRARSAAEQETVVETDALVGNTIADKYRLDAKLGSGGMGSIYRATRLMIGDQVAVKVLHSNQTDPNAAERFQREARAAARLKHENAVSIHDFGVTESGLQYLVMELVEGQSLRQLIKQQGPLTPSATAEILTQVCAALDEAHRHNIIHRDVKPDNIIVNVLTNGLRVKVLDFGIAKLRDDAAGNLTQTGSILGTPHYMSPEQCLGEELDARSDIYSLGVVAYEMLTGHVPFNSPSSAAVVVQHVNQPPTSPRLVNASLSAATDAAVLRALQKSRDERPQSAGVFGREFKAAVDGMPIGVSAAAKAAERPVSAPTMVLNSQPWAPAMGTSANVARDTMGTPKRSNTAVIIAVTVLATVVLLGLGGLGIAMFSGARDSNPGSDKSPNEVNTSSQTAAKGPDQQTPQALPRQTPPPLNLPALRQEITETLNGWSGAARAHDLDAQMNYYAAVVDPYFRQRNVSAAQIRADRSRAYTRYYKLDVQLSNIQISIDPSGTSATAVFDKAYSFEGDKYLSGSVQTMLWLTKIGPRWLISGEKDLKVYYVNK